MIYTTIRENLLDVADISDFTDSELADIISDYIAPATITKEPCPLCYWDKETFADQKHPAIVVHGNPFCLFDIRYAMNFAFKGRLNIDTGKYDREPLFLVMERLRCGLTMP